MPINRLKPQERKFQKKLNFAELYHDQIEEYIALGHAYQRSMEEAKSNSEIKYPINGF